MNYAKVYEQLIRKAVIRHSISSGYFETHHIVPRSLGGGDDFSNLVDLTYREHFLAHWLLTKMFSGLEKRKMAFAFFAMGLPVGGRRRVITSWQFELIKRCCKQQRLATAKQRQDFVRAQRYKNIKSIIERAQFGANEFLRLDSLKKKSKVKFIRGKHYQDRFLYDVLVMEGAIEDTKKRASKQTHEERLRIWKDKRLLLSG